MYELKTRYVHAGLEKLAFSASGQSVAGSKKSSSLVVSVRVPVGSETLQLLTAILTSQGAGRAGPSIVSVFPSSAKPAACLE